MNEFESCSNCGHELLAGFKFCTQCGKRNIKSFKKEEKRDRAYQVNINSLLTYSIFTLIFLAVAGFTNETFETIVIWSIFFAVVDVAFASWQPGVWSLFRFNLKILPLLTILFLAVCSGVAVSYLVGHMNFFLFEESVDMMSSFSGQQYPLLMAIVFTALFPAIFEELAFRGFIFNNLRFISGEKSAIFGSAFLFGLVHFSILSLFWLIPFGVFLAYFRSRYSTLVYGMVGHFTHNATTILLEYYHVL